MRSPALLEPGGENLGVEVQVNHSVGHKICRGCCVIERSCNLRKGFGVEVCVCLLSYLL